PSGESWESDSERTHTNRDFAQVAERSSGSGRVLARVAARRSTGVNEHDDDAQRVPRKPTRNEGAHPRGPHHAAEATRYRSRQETGTQGEVSTNDPVRFCERCR